MLGFTTHVHDGNSKNTREALELSENKRRYIFVRDAPALLLVSNNANGAACDANARWYTLVIQSATSTENGGMNHLLLSHCPPTGIRALALWFIIGQLSHWLCPPGSFVTHAASFAFCSALVYAKIASYLSTLCHNRRLDNSRVGDEQREKEKAEKNCVRRIVLLFTSEWPRRREADCRWLNDVLGKLLFPLYRNSNRQTYRTYSYLSDMQNFEGRSHWTFFGNCPFLSCSLAAWLLRRIIYYVAPRSTDRANVGVDANCVILNATIFLTLRDRHDYQYFRRRNVLLPYF